VALPPLSPVSIELVTPQQAFDQSWGIGADPRRGSPISDPVGPVPRRALPTVPGGSVPRMALRRTAASVSGRRRDLGCDNWPITVPVTVIVPLSYEPLSPVTVIEPLPLPTVIALAVMARYCDLAVTVINRYPTGVLPLSTVIQLTWTVDMGKA